MENPCAEILKLCLHQHAHLAQKHGARARHGTPHRRTRLHSAHAAQQITEICANLGLADEMGVHRANSKRAAVSMTDSGA